MRQLPAARSLANLPLAPATLILRTLPSALHEQIFSLVANFLARGQSFNLDELEGHRICLHITDVGRSLNFIVREGRLVPGPNGGFDARIGGGIADFLVLALRSEDPDTLFFERRLTLEGDTAVGLLFKNFLDSIEFDAEAHASAVLGPRMAAPLIGIARRTGVADAARRGLRAVSHQAACRT